MRLFDESFPHFPTFPVVARLHWELLGRGDIFPEAFVNQDADPFLFALDRPWRAARCAHAVRLRNGTGGAGEARYRKQPAPGWRDGLLAAWRERVRAWLRGAHPALAAAEAVTVDVVVPTFRGIVGIDRDPRADTRFVVVVDNPAHPLVRQVEGLTADDTVPENRGASAARNRGLDESTADCSTTTTWCRGATSWRATWTRCCSWRPRSASRRAGSSGSRASRRAGWRSSRCA